MTSPPKAGDASARPSLAEATLTGVRWVAIARLLTEALAFGVMVWLAHLLTPAEFGRAAVALIVNALAVTIAVGGFGAPLVQRRVVERAHLESAQLAALVCGAALTCLTYVLAPVVAEPLFGAATRDLIQLMSPVFLVTSLGVVSQAILQRRLDFRRLSLIEVAALVCGGSVSLALANAGSGAEALILGALASAAMIALLQQAATPIVLPRWHGREGREILAFGTPSAASSLVDVAHKNVDYAILGVKLQAAQVGFYWRAFQLGIDHQRKISGILMRIALPVYSRADDAEHRRRIRARIVKVQTAVIFPLLATLITVAPVLIPWLLGDRWSQSVAPAQILAVAGMAVCVLTGLGPLMIAAGEPRALLAFNLLSATAFACVVLLTAPLGLIAVCVAVTAFYVTQVLAAHRFLFERLLGIPMRQVLADVTPAGVSAAALLVVAFPTAQVLERLEIPALLHLAATGLVAAAVYLGVLRLLFQATWSDLVLVVRRVAGRRTRATEQAPLSPAVG